MFDERREEALAELKARVEAILLSDGLTEEQKLALLNEALGIVERDEPGSGNPQR